LLCAAVAGAAIGLKQLAILKAVSPMLLAMALGMLIHNLVRTPAAARPGVQFAQKPLLRWAIVLLGLQLTLAQVIAVGPAGLLVIVAATFATFGFTVWLGRVLGVERGLTELIAAGTSICGASAIVATNTVTNAREDSGPSSSSAGSCCWRRWCWASAGSRRCAPARRTPRGLTRRRLCRGSSSASSP
jgi:uncharacterized membrane protein YadS